MNYLKTVVSQKANKLILGTLIVLMLQKDWFWKNV